MEAKEYATIQPIHYWRNQGENKIHLVTNENEITTIQNQWEAAKAVLRG